MSQFFVQYVSLYHLEKHNFVVVFLALFHEKQEEEMDLEFDDNDMLGTIEPEQPEGVAGKANPERTPEIDTKQPPVVVNELDELRRQVESMEEDQQLDELQRKAEEEEGTRKVGAAGQAKSTSVFVQGLDPRTSEQDLSVFFTGCGPVKRVTLLKDKMTRQPKGSAYVEFESSDSLPKAVLLQNNTCHGRPLKIQEKRENVPGMGPGGAGGRGGFGPGGRGGFAPRGRGAAMGQGLPGGGMQMMMQMMSQAMAGGYQGRGRGRGRGGYQQ